MSLFCRDQVVLGNRLEFNHLINKHIRLILIKKSTAYTIQKTTPCDLPTGRLQRFLLDLNKWTVKEKATKIQKNENEMGANAKEIAIKKGRLKA
jgi:hypothetical protein